MSWLNRILILGITPILLSCTPNAKLGPGADYTVKGNRSVYEEADTRVFVEEGPIIKGLREDRLHDPNNEAIKTLQDPHKAMEDFPYDRRGGINWVKAIDKGIINPRMSLKGDEQMNIMDMDILFKNTGGMPWVRFPHLAHTRWLDCSNCHPAIFIPQKGANNVGMDAIIAGKYCGRCHDKVAFPLWTCERCHSVTHPGSPDAWWREEDNPYPPTEESKAMLPEL
jgi:c(7)-type cytochrome triheme protein